MIVSQYVVYHNTDRNQQDNNHPYNIPNYQNHLQGNIDIPTIFNNGSNASAINVNIKTSIKSRCLGENFDFHFITFSPTFSQRLNNPVFFRISVAHHCGSTKFPKVSIVNLQYAFIILINHVASSRLIVCHYETTLLYHQLH